MRELTIAGQRVADETGAYVIAEIGHNHQGDVEQAKHLVRLAWGAGFDAVKLQKRDNRSFLTSAEYDAPYHSEHAFGPTYGEHREFLELSAAAYTEIMDEAHALGIAFGATAFDLKSVDFLFDLGVDFIKIASGGIANFRLIFDAAQCGVPLILSTGASTVEDVAKAVQAAEPAAGHIAILQCTSLYPCSEDRLNLLVIDQFREQFPDTVIGLSDHQDGIDMAAPAYVLGARIFEKHVTFSHTAKGSDHAMSLEPAGQAAYVRSLRRVKEALGSPKKQRYPEEIPAVVKQGRRDLVAAKA